MNSLIDREPNLAPKIVFKIRLSKFHSQFEERVLKISTNDFLHREEKRCDISFHKTHFSITKFGSQRNRLKIIGVSEVACTIISLRHGISYAMNFV